MNKGWFFSTKVTTKKLIIALPILGLAVLIFVWAVNTPFWDEWELVPIFQHLHAGHFYWHDFWQQHNEHRLLLPTLILVGMAYITHWNIVIECFLNLIVATISFTVIKKIVSTSQLLKSKGQVLVLLLLALIWFSPVQIENWLWGWQLEWFMNILGVALVAYALSIVKNKKLKPATMVLLLAGGLLAQYSLGNGTLVWPIIIVLLFYLRVAFRQILWPVVTGLISTFIYYFHYVNPAEPSKTLALHKPFQFAEYIFLYLGRPLSFLHHIAMIIGLFLLVSFIATIVYLFLKKKSALAKAVPWVMLGTYAIGSAVITGLARLGFGVGEAASSRYTTISSLLLISVIMLVWQNQDIIRKLVQHSFKILSIAAITILSSLVIIEFAWGLHSAHTQYVKLMDIKQCTKLQRPTSACLTMTYPVPTIVSPRLQYIKSLHWAGY